MKNSREFDEFTKLTDGLLSVPHEKLKSELDKEKRAKKRKKSKVSSASREANGRA